MSDAPVTEPTSTEPTASAEPEATSTPPWGDDFDPERAWKTITNLRKRESDLSKTQLTADHQSRLSEYDRLVEASKTELERAQEAARTAGDQITAMRERVVSADIRAALTGVVPDPAAVIEDLNISRFIGEDGEVNTEAVTALRAKYAALAPEGKRPPAPNPAQGSSASGPSSASQLTKQDVERLAREGKHEEINTAREEGRLNDLLGIK